MQNTADDVGNTIAAQVWVNNVSGGAVNISNLTVDGVGNAVATCTPYVVGIFYQNSAGTVNHLTVRNQRGNRCGVGIQAEGGNASPAVTIENNIIHDVDYIAINTETLSSPTPQLTATIRSNYTDNVIFFGIVIGQGSSVTVSTNVVSNSAAGISISSGTQGSVSGNTVINERVGFGQRPRIAATSSLLA